MSGDKNLFSTLEEKDLQMKIEMGDDGKYHVSGQGMVVFQREHEAPITLTDVKYVPGLKNNLESRDKGYDVVFSKGKVFPRHIITGQINRIGIRVKNLYKLEVDDYATLSSKAEMVHYQDVGELWHRRLGLLHHEALKIMQQISSGLPNGKLEQATTCKGCTLGKYANIHFRIKTVELEQSWGKFTQMFVDLSLQPPPLNKEGIKHELTAPHNPQQNGVAKRTNRSIMGATRAMLHDQILRVHLWAEACNTIVYLQNRSPHRILGMKTPMEAYSGKRPDVSHFRIFGSSFCCHVTKDARKKLDPTTNLGILVGYTDTPHNYWVYLPSTQRIVVRRDLKFDEQKAMRLSLERELVLHADEEPSFPK
eukprot:PITA_33552